MNNRVRHYEKKTLKDEPSLIGTEPCAYCENVSLCSKYLISCKAFKLYTHNNETFNTVAQFKEAEANGLTKPEGKYHEQIFKPNDGRMRGLW